MSREDKYHKVHLLAKELVAIIVVVLAVANITFAVYGLYALVAMGNTLQILIWMFGVNPIAYILETHHKWKHKHRVL